MCHFLGGVENKGHQITLHKFSSPRFLKTTPPIEHTAYSTSGAHTQSASQSARKKFRKILPGNYIKSRKEAEILAIYLPFALMPLKNNAGLERWLTG